MTARALVPVWSVASEVRRVVDPATLGAEVLHYSIPSFDATGGGRVEPTSGILSAKLRLQGDEVLISKLNPRKSRVVIVRPSEKPVVCSTEFVALRPYGMDTRFLYYLLSSEVVRQGLDSRVQSVTRSHQRVSPADILRLQVWAPDLAEQRRIADFLDGETRKLDALVSEKTRLLALVDERIDSRILHYVGASRLVTESNPTIPVLPVRRQLLKVVRPARPVDDVITAFRDGQVTARSQRRADGYTLSSTEEAQGQYVEAGDVVVHGLDGFAGAIGTSEAFGNCSPVYHVCTPCRGGDALFLGRLLRVLAVSGYLGLFAISTRERAVDFRNWDLFGRIPIPDVPIPWQEEIGEWIDSARPLRVSMERSFALADERRRALITATMAGQIDVTTARGVD